MAIDCPECGKKAFMVNTLHKVMHFGEVLISNVRCENCGYNSNDILPAKQKKPKIFYVKINTTKDLETKIVKSSTAFIEVPELGLSLLPTPSSQGYITNIEGLLEKVQDSLESIAFLEDSKEQREKISEQIKKIEKARNAELKFKVIVEDAFGNSALIGKKAKSKPLSKKRIEELRKLMGL